MEPSARRFLETAALFDAVSDAVWICDPEHLMIRGANRVAIERFGHRGEIRTTGRIPDIVRNVDPGALRKPSTEPSPSAGTTWQIRCEDGAVRTARARWRIREVDSTAMLVVTMRDIGNVDPVKEDVLRNVETIGDLSRALFEAAPGKFLVLRAGTHRIVAASDAYLEATMTKRDSILGRALFEVFPDDPDDPAANGSGNLRTSLSRVEANGLTDVMGVQRYPIPRPQSHGGGFDERFWSPVNTPVHGPDGRVSLIIHRVEDVTDHVRQAGEASALQELEDRASHLRQDIVLRSRELRGAYEHLQEQTGYLRAAQRLLGLGVWKMDLDTRQLTWLDEVHPIYGVDASFDVHDINGYLQLVHPADRKAFIRNLETWLANPGSHFGFRHRIVQPSGEIVHISGLAELNEIDGRRQLTGVVQDVTEEERTAGVLARGRSLSRFAGEAARLGGWRVDLREGFLEWSEQTAAIHELEGEHPRYSVEEGIRFYAPEYREIIRQRFDRCVETGASFDEVLQIVTARGNRRWVRAIGEAEHDPAGEVIAVQGAFQDITDQIGARCEFEELTERVHLTLENMRDPFLLLDEQLRFVFLNAAAEQTLEQPRDSLIGMPIDVAFPFDDTNEFQTYYERALHTGKSEHFNAEFRPLNAYFRVDAHPVPNGLAIYFCDISREREREEQLRLLEAAVSQQSDMLLITEAEPIDDPEGPRIVYVNDAFVRQTGFSRSEAIGSTPRILQGPGTDREVLARIQTALRRREPVREELLNYTRAGDAYWLELDIVPVRDQKGTTSHFVAVERDVTERRRMEAATRLSDERFQLVARATNDVIWDWDLERDEVWWNEGLETLFGHAPAELEPGPESWTNRIHPEDREAVLASIQEVIDGVDSNWSHEYRFLHADGDARIVIDRGFVLRDEDGRAARMLGSMQDVSEQRRTSDQLRQAHKLEAVGQLTGGVAHDFNNLLTVILGNAEMLVEELGATPRLRGMADMMASAASRGADLTSRLLAFARRQALEPQVLNVNRLLAGIEGLLRRTLQENIDIELVQAGGVWHVEVDASQLESAVLNLAINARDAMPGGGRLTIETANAMLDDSYADSHLEVEPGQYVLISVSDTGTGMPEEVVQKAFDPFFTTKEVGRGSGLGLSMVYGFVKQSGGHAKVYSELGEGTAVKLYFPRSLARTAANPAAGASPPIRGGEEHILVVEDDILVRQHVTRLLNGLGYRVTCADSGDQALVILQERSDIDLLFTDVVMPGNINGRELADRASELYPDLGILFTSGYTENAIVHHGRLDAGVDLLSKPYRRHELATKIRKVLEEPRWK